LLGRSLPGQQQQPSFASTDGTQLGAGPEEHLASQFVDARARQLHHMERVVDDGGMFQANRVVDRVPERTMQVHNDHADIGLLLRRERVEGLVQAVQHRHHFGGSHARRHVRETCQQGAPKSGQAWSSIGNHSFTHQQYRRKTL